MHRLMVILRGRTIATKESRATCDLIVVWFITISGVAKGEPGRAQALPNTYCTVPSGLQEVEDTLIEQSDNLLKQSVGQVVPCQLTQSSYATNHNAIKYIRESTQSTAILEVSSAQVYTYLHLYFL